ncbi:MAG: SDR family oxidoreductase [Pseudolysinimonas sp.]
MASGTDHTSGEFAERIALVTGGASGIGEAVVRALARQMARVVIVDLSTRLSAGVQLVNDLGEDRAMFVEVDVRDDTAIDEAFDQVEQRWGVVDLLVTSAGVDSHPDIVSRVRMDQLELRQWDFVIDVNLIGTFSFCRAFAARAISAGSHGTIVTLASLAARKPKGGVYSVSKAGVWMLTRVLAAELGPYGIRVNAVAPGLIDTPMLRRRTALGGALPGADPGIHYADDIARLPLRRLGTTAEVSDAILYLAGNASTYVTGSLISPDGGFASFAGGG